MIEAQQDSGHETPRFYAYCPCGVCGPIRFRYEDAKLDEREHDSVCSMDETQLP